MTLAEAEEILEEEYDNFDYITVEEDEEHAIVVYPRYLRFGGFDIYEGTFFQRYDDGELYADWDLILIVPEGGELTEYFYYEQAGMIRTALTNFCNAVGINFPTGEALIMEYEAS